MYNLKIAFRRLINDKVISTINFIGLTIGIMSFLILFLNVSNEKSFDKHISEHENIYRVTSVAKDNDVVWAKGIGVIHTASQNIPEVELATRFTHFNDQPVQIGENTFQQNNIMAIDEAFVEIFEVKTNIGDLLDINKPNTVFISEDFARKHFGESNPIGRTISVGWNPGKFEICGIVKNTHPKTHFRYDLLLSQKGALQRNFEEFLTSKKLWAYYYYKLKDGTNPNVIAGKVKAYYNESDVVDANGPKEYDFRLTPIIDIHLKSDCRFELEESSGMQNTGLFILISFVILLISLLNYTNLTIVRLMKRSKELGFKKSIGANKIQIIGQIIFEVFIFCFTSIIVAFIITELIRPIINQSFEIDFRIYYEEPIVYLSILAVLVFCVGFATFFVAVFLLQNRSVTNLLICKNSFSGNPIFKMLLVGQVAIVIILLSGTFLVNKQIHFILNKPLGFDKENVVVLHVRDFSKDPTIFANELEKISQVVSTGFTRQHFGYPTQGISLEFLGLEGGAEMIVSNFNYLKTMDIKLLENWNCQPAETAEGLIVNNHLYKRLMTKYGSIETVSNYQEDHPIRPGVPSARIIGVVEDFDYNSAHQAIGDFVFMLGTSRHFARFMHVRLAKGSLKSGIESIKKAWQVYYPDTELDYFFVDEKIAAQYKAEAILSRILFTFSLVGVLISIMGISALAVFISQQRTKEIGIRKVNGAKISEILTMLNKDFIKWVTIAFVIACPVAYYAMNKWLENFAYKTNLSWWIFALAGVLALGIALFTVSWQSWRAATRNPVEALRYE